MKKLTILFIFCFAVSALAFLLNAYGYAVPDADSVVLLSVGVVSLGVARRRTRNKRD